MEIALALEVILVIGLPIALWFLLRRRPGVTWGLIAAGALAFAASQVARLPLDALTGWLVGESGLWPFAPESAADLAAKTVYLGLAAGLCEELARYLILRHWRKEARSWEQGVAFGAGHGGLEAVIVGLLVLVGLASMIALRTTDLNTLDLTEEALSELQNQMETYWSMPWYLPLLGALERVFGMTIQIGLSLMVVESLRRENPGWLIAAVLTHAIIDGVAAWAIQAGWPPLAIEGLVLVFAVGALVLIKRLHDVSRETPPG
jgi:uncharacterized membrane protein YhfC